MRLMNKKYQIILILLVTMIILSSCSGGLDNSNKINIKTDKLKFNDETGDKIRPEFGTVFFEITKLSTEFYNTYIGNPEDERLISLKDNIFNLVIYDMDEELFSNKSSNILEKYYDKNYIEYEEEIYRESILIVGDILIRVEQDEAILKEEKLREKNLKDMDDEKFNKLKENKKEHINTIKENIMNVLDKYFEF